MFVTLVRPTLRAVLVACALLCAALVPVESPRPAFADPPFDNPADDDDDNDGVWDVAEANCGGDALDPAIRPERLHDNFAGTDDDGDAAVDEALPGGASAYDCDGDGFTGAAEAHVFGGATDRDQRPCGTANWPADFIASGMSANRVDISDITSYVAPVRHLNTSSGDGGFDLRWDIYPGSTFGETINVQDLTAIVTARPAMYGGVRMFNATGRCPWPITPGAYAASLPIPNATYSRMVALVPVPGAPDEAVVVQQQARLAYRISLSGAFAPVLFGNLTSVAGGAGGEEGFLALAFPPGYPGDSEVYAWYTEGSPNDNVLARVPVSGGVMDVANLEVLISIPDPYTNHNGGELKFGPDGYLYLSIGDGGSGDDPLETGQDVTDLFGSVLRLDVSAPAGYSSPPGNPFFGATPGRDEIFAYGLRNPWRFSFDDYTGDLWLSDVGQSAREEVDLVTLGGNYGWDDMEGTICHEPTSGCATAGRILPRAEYDHSLGCSITGGYVYRGAAMPELAGWYIYGDYCSGRIWAVNTLDASAPVQLVDTPHQIASFAELPNGDHAILTFGNAIYRLVRN